VLIVSVRVPVGAQTRVKKKKKGRRARSLFLKNEFALLMEVFVRGACERG
jgi:hypothetical protein